MKMFLAGLIAGASMMLAVPAMASTVVAFDDTPDYATLATYSTSIGDGTYTGATFTASVSNKILSPFASGGAAYSSTGFFAAGPDASTMPNPSTLSFTSVQNYFSFLLGSPDKYNVVTFSLAGNFVNTLEQILFAGGYTDAIYTRTGAAFISIADIAFDSVTFFASEQAIEFASISTVPVPAGVLLLGSALAGLGFLARRKKASSGMAFA